MDPIKAMFPSNDKHDFDNENPPRRKVKEAPWLLVEKVMGVAFLVLLAGWASLWAAGGLVGEARWGALLLIGILFITLCVLRAGSTSTNGWIRRFLVRPSQYQSFTNHHPSYRFVDYAQAAERVAATAEYALQLDSHPNLFHQFLPHIMSNFSTQQMLPSARQSFCVGYEKLAFFPTDLIWLVRGIEGLPPGEKIVVRLRIYQNSTLLEVACRNQSIADAFFTLLNEDALENSIFRGQFIEIRYSANPHRDYEYQYEAAEMTVTFKEKPNVAGDAIILDPRIDAILRRNIFDFFMHREELHALGLPRKRALLFYGPPGTGKTHTCRYVHTLLPRMTAILATGEALTKLQDLGRLARQLQPTLVILEDVDLIFSSREINPYTTALGDLMDQLDGFTPDEEVIFVLTTNAIERVEQAIRDRPGRINQCLFFGPPTPDLRRRYLLQYLKEYRIDTVDMDHVVRQTEGTSQAFLKEYVLRAVQIAAEAAGYPRSDLSLKTEHFDTAFDELTSHGDPAGHSIMGFRTVGG